MLCQLNSRSILRIALQSGSKRYGPAVCGGMQLGIFFCRKWMFLLFVNWLIHRAHRAVPGSTTILLHWEHSKSVKFSVAPRDAGTSVAKSERIFLYITWYEAMNCSRKSAMLVCQTQMKKHVYLYVLVTDFSIELNIRAHFRGEFTISGNALFWKCMTRKCMTRKCMTRKRRAGVRRQLGSSDGLARAFHQHVTATGILRTWLRGREAKRGNARPRGRTRFHYMPSLSDVLWQAHRMRVRYRVRLQHAMSVCLACMRAQQQYKRPLSAPRHHKTSQNMKSGAGWKRRKVIYI